MLGDGRRFDIAPTAHNDALKTASVSIVEVTLR
jgi:hypothetical protein